MYLAGSTNFMCPRRCPPDDAVSASQFPYSFTFPGATSSGESLVISSQCLHRVKMPMLRILGSNQFLVYRFFVFERVS